MDKKKFELLIVEDDTADLDLIREALDLRDERSFDINLSSVEDGEQALSFLRKRNPYSDAPKPDLIILDLNMPKKGGHEVLKEIKADDVRREAMKVDISALLGGDIYSMLRDRSVKAKSRFSKERDDDRALQERQNCLIALKKDFDIPAEVLAALPSPEQILAKAEAAKQRAEAALKAAASSTGGPAEEPWPEGSRGPA